MLNLHCNKNGKKHLIDTLVSNFISNFKGISLLDPEKKICKGVYHEQA